MISLLEYFGKFLHHPDATDQAYENAERLLDAVGKLEDFAKYDNIDLPINPMTKSRVSGTQYGGFRPHNCPEGSVKSSHKTGEGIDLYDPQNALDEWVNDSVLEACELYREDPGSTQHWCHLTTRAPGSGHRTFMP